MTKQTDRFSESLEDYLEAIVMLGGSNVRSVDLANQLGVTKASVNHAVNTLIASGMVIKAPYGDISLTDLGKTTSENVLRKHMVIKHFLIDILGVSEIVANDEACGIEHNISDDTLERFEALVNRLKSN
ncbi:MAG: metal-dependent transcriptional regulator [Tenericutes bacterium HGW-Tenericutes-1]|jgi:Mn-dependent DtxR family transcriptional regulator|nr:MAG: metal-dependent transcriptional regulator [Tenericutes bacterium HGW-Tenericutes-1]